jgi:hypothetical protein
MAVNVAMAYLLLNHCVKGAGPTHPHSMQRIYRTIDNYEVDDRSVGLESSAYFLKAIFDPSTKQPQPKDAQEAFHWVIERLRKLFPNY